MTFIFGIAGHLLDFITFGNTGFGNPAQTQRVSDFINAINNNFLTQHVKEPTRGDNILDLVLTTEEGMVSEVTVSSPIAMSDHNVVKFLLHCGTNIKNETDMRLNYNKANYFQICEKLSQVDWEEKFKNKNVEQMWDIFLQLLFQNRDEFVPKKVIYKRKYPKWIKGSVIRNIRKRNKAWERFVLAPSYDKKSKYKQLRNDTNKMIKKAKREFEALLADKIKYDPKSFYAYIKSKYRTKVQIGPLIDKSGKLMDKSEDMSLILNEYFSSVFTIEDLSNIPEAKLEFSNDLGNELSDLDITKEKISKAIKNTKLNKAGGVDGLPSSFIKGLEEAIVEPLTLLFKSSLESGEVPMDWKSANISAIFKKGSKKDPGNYRPVSLTSHICKIFEKILKEELVNHLESNKILKESQHGFRAGKSCLTNLLEFTEYISKNMDKGEPIDIIYLDFQKAFDKVPHTRLMNKIQACGVKGKVLNWIRNWLFDRRQRVCIDGNYSDWSNVVSGVPQGSVLGPILFTIFINDIDDKILSKLLKFADDTKLIGKVKSSVDIEILRKDLANLYRWSEDWQMLFNVNKCKIMHIGRNNTEEKYYMGGKELIQINEETDLGVLISNDFKVFKQCAKAAKKGNQVLGMIWRTFECKNKDIIVKLYKSLVRPHLDYCCQAWRPHLIKDIVLIERVQRRATKMIWECKGKSYLERLKILHLTTIETRMLRADLLEVFKILNGMENVEEKDFFERSSRGGVSRGHGLKLFKNRVNLDVGKYSFGNRICNEWNMLPENIVMSKSVNEFKGKIDRYLASIRGLK